MPPACIICQPAVPLLPLQYIFTHCHVYDEKQNYVPFDFKKEEPFFAVQRKVLPESM